MVVRLIVQTLLWCAFMGVLLFWPAGTLHWPAAWIFLIEMAALSIGVGIWLAKRDPALLAERMTLFVQRGQKAWDRAFIAAFLVSWCGWLVLMALDAERYHWSTVPVWLQAVGALCFALCMYVAALTFRENSYASPVIKIQRERGQHVISTGRYRYVRHPMYAGALLFFVGVPLLLGSWWGLAAVPFMTILLGGRAVMEERLLAAELEGYTEYMARVRYRLVPGVW
jgi:protein-S-isoprenylcysteine O-methyltransferase Ste14